MLNLNSFTEFVSLCKNSKSNNTNRIFTYIQETTVLAPSSLIDSSKDYFYINIPASVFSYFATGEILSFNYIGNAETELERVTNISGAIKKDIPLFVGGMKFPIKSNEELWNDFQIEKWFVPRVLVLRKLDKYYLVINFLYSDFNSSRLIDEINKFLFIKKELDPHRSPIGAIGTIEEGFYENWDFIVNTALSNIKKEKITKVVLARRKKVNLNHSPCIREIIFSLENNYPECYIFSYKVNNSIFFGATPERLARIENGIIETDAMAGSIKRGIDETEDNFLVHKILKDKKEIEEHRAVVDYLLDKLSFISDNIEFNKQPLVKKLSNIQHLWVSFKAKLKKEVSILTAIKQIFPTPAVCGYPKENALEIIEELEEFDRGMYAGIIGWFNNEGTGDFAVPIRSALIKENTLYAYAGCGIVEGSNSLNEYKETELKFKPIISLFENANKNETINQP